MKTDLYIKTDFLVIGSGIAGLSFALKASGHGKVVIVTKEKAMESNTKYAQGGIAVVWDPIRDSPEKHIEDTMTAGAGLNNRNIVELVVREAHDRVEELIRLGVNFDTNEKGTYDLAKEGGHSEHRILHHKDITGLEIEQKLLQNVLKNPNIVLLENHFAVDILTQHHLGEIVTSQTKGIECYGAYVLNVAENKVFRILARKTIMAGGGIGQVYASTTNPLIATGDAIAMVYRAKGFVKDMEFVQFHPTSFYQPGASPSFLITEALRGAGAVLKNHAGEEFMYKYDSRGSLAPRDIVARAIDHEMKISGKDFVYLDARHIDRKHFISHFPNIYDHCMKSGIDPFLKMIPVVPAQHYICGGIETDEWARTNIKNLYAIGECACTGLHGANRLASNSLLESVVFAHRASVHASQTLGDGIIQEKIPEWNAEGTVNAEEMILITQSRKEVQQIMSNYVGIVRSDIRLKRAWDRLELIYKENEELYDRTTISVPLCELRNIICVGYLIIKHAMRRKKSIGLHYMATEK
ncbi:MAG: L-aspartate oxidase [Bacteroidia bacterium]|nr:L-aspartate oxidase [Bacteroidia bacterium]